MDLHPAIDTTMLARTFARDRRVRISPFLVEEDAEALSASLRGRSDWRLVINQQDKLFELDREAQGALSATARSQLDDAVFAAGRYDFQYRYEAIRVPDDTAERQRSSDPLAGFASFLSSGKVRDLLRAITGQPQIAFADAQATAYSPGHFLTAHDDEVSGKNRLAAYVYNLSPTWRIDWGGLLLFHDDEGHVAQGLAPSFNALNLFAVPQPHSVSLVSPSAAFRRYSVTGWLRAS